MKAIVVISAVVGLTLVALYVVASLKGLTLREYLESLWGDIKLAQERSRQDRIAKEALEWKSPFGDPWIEM